MNRRSSPRTLTIRVWLVARSGSTCRAAHVDPVGHQGLRGEAAEDIVAHPGADGDADAQPGQVDRGVGGAAADVEDQLVDRHEFARAGQAGDGRGHVIDDDHPRAGDRGAVGGGCRFGERGE